MLLIKSFLLWVQLNSGAIAVYHGELYFGVTKFC